MRTVLFTLFFCVLQIVVNAAKADDVTGTPWPRYAVDASSRGADGARLADVNQDGHPDIVTPWEEGGVIRVYLHPGPAQVHAAWPQVTVGRVAAPEDALFVDLDQDGAVDVVSCTEGDNKSVYVHWAPKTATDYLNPAAWTTQAFPATQSAKHWMFALAQDIDQQHGPDLLIGAKNAGAEIGWLEAPAQPRQVDQWRYHPIRRAGWIMTLAPDSQGEGWWFTDRKGPSRGCYRLFLEGAEPAEKAAWHCSLVGGDDHEVMFMAPPKARSNATPDTLVATRDNGVLRFSSEAGAPFTSLPMPQNAGTGKSVAATDLDGDGQAEVVVSCEHAEKKHGLFYLQRHASNWPAHAISGLKGTKFDLLQLVDLDEDGDLDILTCEEREGLGVIWFSNPGSPAATVQQ